MPIYDRPTRVLMHEFAKEQLQPDQFFTKQDAVSWFDKHYPKIQRGTVELHVEGMAVNTGLRRSHANIRLGSGHDLFLKVGRGQFRLWDAVNDPAPIYKSSPVESPELDDVMELEATNEAGEEFSEFAFERDLQNFLQKNMSALEPGLRLYDDDGLSGVEYPAGGRRIDLLGVGTDGALVVVELKVSRGYDRVIGQLLRYIGWVRANLAQGKLVRGIIVASEITQDLKLAASALQDVKLVEYELSFRLKVVS